MRTPEAGRTAATAAPSGAVMAWLEAQLRAQVIPINPDVALAEADVWDEWARNAVDGTDAVILGTAARLARSEQSPEAVRPPDADLSADLAEGQTESVLPGYGTLLSAIRSVTGESDDQNDNVLIPWGNCLARLVRDFPVHVDLHRLAERWFTALRANPVLTPADTLTAQWAHVACWRASSVAGDPFVDSALQVIQRILTASSGVRPQRDAVAGTLTINGLRETVGDPGAAGPAAESQPYQAIRILRSPDLPPTVGGPAHTTAYQLIANISHIGWEHHPNIEPFLRYLPTVAGNPAGGVAAPQRDRASAPVDRRHPRPSVDVVFSSVGAPQFGDPFRGYAYVVTHLVALTPIRALPA